MRRFNEENNEEAGEHWTPRDAVRLMARLVFEPIECRIKTGTRLLYDCACGTGGALPEIGTHWASARTDSPKTAVRLCTCAPSVEQGRRHRLR